MERRCRSTFSMGLRSPGKNVNSEILCAPGHLPEKKGEREGGRGRGREGEGERDRERKNDTGRPSLGETGLQLYFQKWLLCVHPAKYVDLSIDVPPGN